MSVREFFVDVALLIGLVLLLPLAIPIGALAFVFLIFKRSSLWPRSARA